MEERARSKEMILVSLSASAMTLTFDPETRKAHVKLTRGACDSAAQILGT